MSGQKRMSTLTLLLILARVAFCRVPMNPLTQIEGVERNDSVDSVSSASESPADESYICLELAPDLPICHFEQMRDAIATSRGLSESKSDRFAREIEGEGVPILRELSENVGNSYNTGSGRDSTKIITVYKLDGCLPSRLPFQLPLCAAKDFTEGTVVIHKLIPYKMPRGYTYEINSKGALIFPEIDHDHWLKLMRRFRETHVSSTLLHGKNPVASTKEENVPSRMRFTSEVSNSSGTTERRANDPSQNENISRSSTVEENHFAKGKGQHRPKVLLEKGPAESEATSRMYYDTVVNSAIPNDNNARLSERSTRSTREQVTGGVADYPNDESMKIDDDSSIEDIPIGILGVEKTGRNVVGFKEEFPYEIALPYDAETAELFNKINTASLKVKATLKAGEMTQDKRQFYRRLFGVYRKQLNRRLRYLRNHVFLKKDEANLTYHEEPREESRASIQSSHISPNPDVIEKLERTRRNARKLHNK